MCVENTFAIWWMMVIQKRGFRSADGNCNVDRRGLLRAGRILKIFRDGIAKLLGFGDDLGAQGIGDTFVSAEHLPDGGPGDAQGICNFL